MGYKPVPGWESYEISDCGDLRRLKGGPRTRVGFRQKPSVVRVYPRVHLSHEGAKRNWYIHQLVLLTFVGPCPPGHESNHKNGVKTDNRLANLEYVTAKTNMRHAVASGLRNFAGLKVGFQAGESHSMTTLTDEKVLEIRGSASKPKDLAQRYNVSVWTIYNIRSRRVWQNIDSAVNGRN